MKPNESTTIDTAHGPAAVQIIDHGEHRQFNCFLPPAGGAGLFALMPNGLADEQCCDIFRDLLEMGPHAEDMDLSEHSPHILGAGSVNMAQFNLTKAIEQAQERKPCHECEPWTGKAPVAPAMTLEDYQRALAELDKREGLTDEQRQMVRNRIEQVLLPAISPV